MERRGKSCRRWGSHENECEFTVWLESFRRISPGAGGGWGYGSTQSTGSLTQAEDANRSVIVGLTDQNRSSSGAGLNAKDAVRVRNVVLIRLLASFIQRRRPIPPGALLCCSNIKHFISWPPTAGKYQLSLAVRHGPHPWLYAIVRKDG